MERDTLGARLGSALPGTFGFVPAFQRVKETSMTGSVRLAGALFLASALASASETSVELSTSKGDDRAANEASLKQIGLPAYPGAHVRKDSGEDSQATLGFMLGGKGFRLVALKFETAEPPAKVLAFYHRAIGRFGETLTCPGGAPTASGLSCKDSALSAGTTELQAGSKEERRIVGVESAPGGGTRFELVYLKAKGVDVK
jgi:hypothetical protein